MIPIEVAIIEDRKDYRDVLKTIVDGTNGFTCQATYANGNAALSGIRNQQPDIVLVDIGLPDISGIECIKTLKDEFPEIQFLVISMADDEEKIFEALTAGAEGYLTKDTSHSKIIESIQALVNGGAPMSASIAKKVLRFFNTPNKEIAEAYKKNLSKREIEVLEFLVKGWSYKKIAETMFVTPETIKSHCGSIYKKLHVKSKDTLINKVYTQNPMVFKLQEENNLLKAENARLQEEIRILKSNC